MRLPRRTFLTLTLATGAAALGACRTARAGERERTPLFQPRRAEPAGSAGRTVQTLDVGGQTRRYIRYAPPSLPADAPVPLVLVLHGRGGNGAVSERAYGFSPLAEAHGFVVAYPDALDDPPMWNSSFAERPRRADDAGFLRALVEHEATLRPLDRARTYVCGHSSGAMMSYRLAGGAPDLFPAVGIVAGAVGFRLPSGAVVTMPPPDRPVSVIHFHGTHDRLIPYAGGNRTGGSAPGFVSVAESIAYWVRHNQCDPTPVTETVGNSSRETYTNPATGVEVTLWTVHGGGHEWPGRSAIVGPSGVRADISATALLWAFFAAHPRHA